MSLRGPSLMPCIMAMMMMMALCFAPRMLMLSLSHFNVKYLTVVDLSLKACSYCQMSCSPIRILKIVRILIGALSVSAAAAAAKQLLPLLARRCS